MLLKKGLTAVVFFCSTTVIVVVVQADWIPGVCLLGFFKFVILITGRNFANKHTPEFNHLGQCSKSKQWRQCE